MAAFFNLAVDSITVHKAGSDEFEPFADWGSTGNNEWRVHFSVESASGSFKYDTQWSNDSVTSGKTYEIDKSWLFVLSEGEKINLSVTAFEDDWASSNDDIPGIQNLVLDPATMGKDYNLSLGDPKQEYYYTLNLDGSSIA